MEKNRKIRWMYLIRDAVNFCLILASLAILAIGAYAVWDTWCVTEAASPVQYEKYKPKGEDASSLEELMAINPEVVGWLSVYGTQIDYPLVQAANNNRYLNTNAKGGTSACGALFLDYRNAADFSDFNTVIYGHHMANHLMFGDIDEFLEQDFFDSHAYGSLFYGGTEHGLVFWAVLEADGYDSLLYAPGLTGERREALLERIAGQALFLRELDVNEADQLVLLSTCADTATNGRYLLVGKVTDETYANAFAEGAKTETSVDKAKRFALLVPGWMWGLALLALLLIVIFPSPEERRQRKVRRERGFADKP